MAEVTFAEYSNFRDLYRPVTFLVLAGYQSTAWLAGSLAQMSFV